MKKSIIILVLLLIIGMIGCKSTPEIKETAVVKGPETVIQAIKEAEMSLAIANQVIPFKDKFNTDIRTLVAEANEAIAEARKARIAGDHEKALTYAVQAKTASDMSMEKIKAIMEKANEEKRVIVEKEILKAKEQGKDTFEAENYLQQKNYDMALQAVDYAEEKVSGQTGLKRIVVVWGDSLWSLAVKIYKDGFEWKRLWKANKNIKDPNKIWPGQVINAPVLK
jgi:nucleoid-associated protein YgaU